jgi:signal transduction histidine kinase
MARRILLALLGLVVAVVATVTVLLAVNATGYDRSTFINDTEDTLRSYSVLEQSVLSCQPEPALLQLIPELSALGDHLEARSIDPRCDKYSFNRGVPNRDWSALLARATALDTGVPVTSTAQPVAEEIPGWVVAAIAVNQSGSDQLAGYVLLARSTSSLNSEIFTLWTVLTAAGVAGLLGALLIAVWLARWTSKPLAALDTVARKVADGDLTVRARSDYGPPEVRRLARTFNTMAGRLENLVHGSRAVLADVSHQLRTPLAALRLRLDFLAAEAAETDPDMAAELNGAQDELIRLSRLVDGLLAVARAENVQPQPKAIDVAEVAEERVAAWLPVAEDRGIFLSAPYTTTGTATGIAPVLGWLGEGHLEQVLDNLIDNALEALSAGNSIEVTASYTESGVRVMVRDNGPGMTPEMRERAFLRFTSNSPGGTGIGLAIVQRLVTANGGTADLQDSPGGGLTVLLDFPSGQAEAEDDTADLPAVGNAKITR